MSNGSKSSLYFYGSLITALWFLLTCWLWTYLANVFISFPFGILAYFLWRKGLLLDERKERYKITYWLLITGAVLSFVSLIVLLIYN